MPETPASELRLKTNDGVPECRVIAHDRWPAVRCEIFYSVDDDPRARFWRSADVTRRGDTFVLLRADEYEQLTGKAPSFTDWLLNGPRIDDLELPRRDASRMRDASL